ncbi:MAG: hypothetical protein K2P76_09595 [Lachnospiraceae bacterium]|nr:hypothetical protein [Lachnospiraceae bacterium]MDE6980985.1 hypothetical protein [Lachnospiraceae bacterium]
MGKDTAFFVLGFCCVILLSGCGKSQEHPISKVILEGQYGVEGVENIIFTFYKDSTLKVEQSGIYEFGKNSQGKNILKICFDDITRELPEDYNFTEYLVDWDRRYVYLTLDVEPAGDSEQEEKPKPMALRLLKGTEGISKGEPFSGTYQIGGEGSDYQYIFSKDGRVLMEIYEYYYIEEEKLTLSDSSGSTDYTCVLSENQIKINNLLGENILSLIKK